MIALAENDDRHRIYVRLHDAFNNLDVPPRAVDGLAALLTDYQPPRLAVVNDVVVVVDEQGEPRTRPCRVGSGAIELLPIETFIVEEFIRDEPRARWRPYP